MISLYIEHNSNNEIELKHKIPWHLSDDFTGFNNKTKDIEIVVRTNTHDSK